MFALLMYSSASGQMPDLFTTYVGKRTAYITETGMVMDLNSYLTDSFKGSFNPAACYTQSANGEIYTIPPSMAVCHVFYANTAILDKLGLEFPDSYSELLSQVDTIRDAGYYPVSMGNKDQWVVNSWLLSALVDRTGGKEWFNDAVFEFNDGGQQIPKNFNLHTKSIEVIINYLRTYNIDSQNEYGAMAIILKG